MKESFRSVDFIKIPNFDHAQLFQDQMEAFHRLLFQRIAESRSVAKPDFSGFSSLSKMSSSLSDFFQRRIRTDRGTLFPDRVWFGVLQKVIENFDDQDISMSKIFAQFLISESAIVNRVYNFFDILYGKLFDKASFVRCRSSAVQMLAVQLVLEARQKGINSLGGRGDEAQGSYTVLLNELLDRIRRRTPCQELYKGYRCTQVSQVSCCPLFLLALCCSSCSC